jgi:O-6-methylguanine DNA methyltransferase
LRSESPRSAATSFVARVLHVVSRVPPGKVATYGDVARLAGRPRAARAVGTIMSRASRPGLPYHRVVAAGGRLGGYGGSDAIKAGLLRAEGVIVQGRRIRDFERHRWPLRHMRGAARR